ncbi:copper amine oxidase N-terminal domain-containing protein [Desulfofundulus sp. TPOSR]|uniref:copper amine oxidase N-terminal domain-containing protein n=1 Tax=Desulfofundulus sp. TPOSR TaxID=2714340 RepID=UPI0014073550|nr:copper amine oxidase N-terminal domain-containing protein [Desulfofundulus sp. TPOSR]NHM26959.1 copper amine oxidase N-terminal domain-containing protein [Desulfofundulus sp. TPOSR]
MRKAAVLFIAALMLLSFATFAWAEAQDGGGGPSNLDAATHGVDNGFIDGSVPVYGGGGGSGNVAKPITIVVNGNEIRPDVAPMVKSGRTFVPYRFIAEALGCRVDWDGKDQKVTAEKDGLKVVMYVGRKAAYVNGMEKQMDVAPMVKSGRTFVPVRFISEGLGYNVRWESDTWTVIINSQDYDPGQGFQKVSYNHNEPRLGIVTDGVFWKGGYDPIKRSWIN